MLKEILRDSLSEIALKKIYLQHSRSVAKVKTKPGFLVCRPVSHRWVILWKVCKAVRSWKEGCWYRLQWLHGEAGKWIDMKKLNQFLWVCETTFFLSVESSVRSLLDPCFSLTHWWCEGSQEEPLTLVSCAAYSGVQKLRERGGYVSWYLDSFKKFCIQLWYQSIYYAEFSISQTFLDGSHQH